MLSKQSMKWASVMETRRKIKQPFLVLKLIYTYPQVAIIALRFFQKKQLYIGGNTEVTQKILYLEKDPPVKEK